MFTTLTMPSYGKVVSGVGVPADPARYDYRRAALDAMHFAKLFDRWMQNLRRCAGYQVQYFAASRTPEAAGPAPACRAARAHRAKGDPPGHQGHLLPVVVAPTPHPAVRAPGPALGRVGLPRPRHQAPLKTWEQALAEIDEDPDAKPAHVMRFGSQVDIKGIIAPHPMPIAPSGT
jgi:hypothetical protein